MQKMFLNPGRFLLLSKDLSLCSNLQKVTVRYFRKPKWLPIAHSKMYRDIEMNIQPAEESQEMKVLHGRYKLYCKSLWLWQRELQAEDEHSRGLKFDVEGSEEMQLKRIVHDNNEINVRVKSIRDKELVEEWVQIKKEIEGMKKSRENEDDQRLKAATKQVLVDMERLKSSINLEDLDEAIEKAMSSEIDYNFAIDTSGNLIRGRSNNGPTEQIKNN